MNKIILGCSLAMSMAFFSCEASKKASVTMNELTQSSWKLESMNNVVNPAYSEGDHFTLSFSAADSTISGVGACNRYFGKMKFEKDGEVEINMGGATMMACPGLDLEQAFFKVMDEADDMIIV
ncbi:MAG: META domain-containing protein, partial [Bacteroidales bacterium]